jgi:hypothetical protein
MENIKRLSVLLLGILLISVMLTGCGNGNDSVKTGLAVVNSISNSTDAVDGEGVAEINTMIYAVTVDGAGKILKCAIDAVQTKAGFSDSGAVITPLDTMYKTKNELGDEYGMKSNSKIGREWNEQASSFAEYVVGKTAKEVSGIAVDDQTYPTGADLTSSVTIHIGDFITGVQKAIENAKNIGSGKDDKLGLAARTDIAKSVNAGDKPGYIQAYSFYAVTTTDANGKITGCILDGSQTNVNFDTTGKITSDLNAVFETKNELGDKYGMKSQSGIGKEWNEQAAAFAANVVGKTAAEVEGIAVDETKHATGADLISSVNISIGEFQETIIKAINGAK